MLHAQLKDLALVTQQEPEERLIGHFAVFLTVYPMRVELERRGTV